MDNHIENTPYAYQSTTTDETAATVDQINQAIIKGLTWLKNNQNADGSWGISFKIAQTGLAVLKFETRARELGLDPFDSQYEYSQQVISGLNFIFANAKFVDIGQQPAGNPDASGDGKGIYFESPEDLYHPNYDTGIALMAITASAKPDRTVEVTGSPVDTWTYKRVAQDAVDFLAWGQTDFEPGRGGWDYEPRDNSGTRSDNSISGWVVTGLGFAASPAFGFNLTIPQFVKSELNLWINYIQNAVDGDTNDGGSGYSDPDNWVNLLKTGNLLQQMVFVGDASGSQRVQNAVAYIVRHWNDPNTDPGWKGAPGGVSNYQATFTIMKGLESIGVDTIDSINWFNDITDALVAQQEADGSWPRSDWDEDYYPVLSTEWALLTLEKAAPPPPPPTRRSSRGIHFLNFLG